MLQRVFANRRSLSCAAVIAILTLVGIFNAVGALAGNINTLGLIKKAALQNTNSYSVLHNEKCIAELTTSFEQSAEQIAFIVRGNLNLKLGSDIRELRISGFAQFNSLKQLTGALLFIRSPDGEIKFQADGITNIKLKVLTNQPELRELLNYTLTGPLLLLDHDDSHYRLSLPGRQLETLLNLPSTGFANTGAMSAFKLQEGLCAVDQKSPLDTTAFVNFAAQFQSSNLEAKLEDYVGRFATK